MQQQRKKNGWYHVRGFRGKKSRITEGLRSMEKWGFGLTRKEILEILCEYIIANGIKTPFKDNRLEEDWLLNFKNWHHLSIKKPQGIEYTRKKKTDPFVVNEYFYLLHKTLIKNHLTTPEQIWNLDEMSFQHDPSKTRVVEAKGKLSSRTTAGIR
ncbi:hypothetical protein Zmor_021242 [Zophobas morio]|uniref:HTH CENPB-type domain-containing protein n=1 Tax=Zophobas morio TaxID=2755281 RepID=A0AA38I5A2_9CUCU|nr:hypothetical protein Zmor_021242 [Zophobas morio]